MNPADTLLAIESIKKLKARYFRCMDAKDWEAFEGLFMSDAIFDMRSGRGENLDPDAVVVGAQAIASFVRSAVGHLTTVHHGHMPEIDLEAGDRASAVWAMEDFLVVPDGVSAPFRSMRGFGHYHDTYCRVGGEWRIASSRLSRLRVDVT